MKHVLIADDSPTMRRMVKASLNSLGDVAFHEVGSGLEALEQVAIFPISLVVLDLNMPDMHGLDVLKFLRDFKSYKSVPVIILTTRGDDDSRAAAMKAGASLYLTKPFAPESLAASVMQLLDGQ
jgi:two-component system chemotaxis response regulator CheY